MDIFAEQTAYRRARPSRLGRGIERLTNPVGQALASFVPNKVVEAVVKGIDSAASAPSLAPIRHDPADLDASRAAALRIERLAKNVNGATGAAAGFGGAISAGLDIPASIAIALRNIRDTGRAYGYDGAGETEKLFRLQILELASLDDEALRAERIAAIENAIARTVRSSRSTATRQLRWSTRRSSGSAARWSSRLSEAGSGCSSR